MKGLSATKRAVLLRCLNGEIEHSVATSDQLLVVTELRAEGRVQLSRDNQYLDVMITDEGRRALRCCPIED